MNLLLKLISNSKFVYNYTPENKVSHLNFAIAFILTQINSKFVYNYYWNDSFSRWNEGVGGANDMIILTSHRSLS